ncbi:MAG: 50S ribosomal protein L30 [Gemmatimonadota bacterium]|jgi:large subunit ribosomal protein L30
MADKKLEITQVRSGIGRPEPHRRTLRALGIRRHQQSVVHEDSPAIRGMIRSISHLVSVREIEA